MSDDGFYRALVQADKCINCGQCLDVCPMNRPERSTGSEPRTAYAAYSTEESVRFQSSSGGVFSQIAKMILKQGGTVYGAAFDMQMQLRHVAVNDIRYLDPLCGSKYLQSYLGGIYEDIRDKLLDGNLVFFVGTPCQVSALYNVLNARPHNLITADVICHGTPAPGLFRQYLNYLERKYHGTIIDYWFRSKENANDRMSYTAKVVLQNGDTVKTIFLDGDEEPYALRFLSNALQNESCYQCPYASLQRTGDLTLGDYWGYETAHPELEHVSGVSLVLVNTQSGADALAKTENLALVKTGSDQYLDRNIHLTRPPVRHSDRDKLYLTFSKEGFSNNFYKKSFLPSGYRLYIIKRRIRSFVKWARKSGF